MASSLPLPPISGFRFRIAPSSLHGTRSLAGHSLWHSEVVCIQLIGRLVPGVTESQALAKLILSFKAPRLSAWALPIQRRRKTFWPSVPRREFKVCANTIKSPSRFSWPWSDSFLQLLVPTCRCSSSPQFHSRPRIFGAHGSWRWPRPSFAADADGELPSSRRWAAFGWMFAISGSQALAAWSGMEIPFVLDSRVLLFTLAISISCAIIFGLAPLRRAVSVPVELHSRPPTPPLSRPEELLVRKSCRRLADGLMPRLAGWLGTARAFPTQLSDLAFGPSRGRASRVRH